MHFIKSKEKPSLKMVLTGILIFLISFTLLSGLILFIGQKQLNARINHISEPVLSDKDRFLFGESQADTQSISWPQDMTISRNDSTYHFNDQQIVLYFMGIDSDSPVTLRPSSEGGQADAHFLIFINKQNKSIRILTINRNTMTDIDIYDLYNKYGYTIPGQLCLQHAYGDGLQDSCLKAEDAMRRAMGNMPVHAYISLNKGIISALNDAIGGVRVTALEDVIFPEPETIIHKGDDILLKGSDAYYYITHRYTDNFGSNNTRLERQKQYVNAMLTKTTSTLLKNPFKMFHLYQLARKYMVTDLSFPEMCYIGYLCMTYQIDPSIQSISGITQTQSLYECFYPDRQSWEDTILDYYYTPEK